MVVWEGDGGDGKVMVVGRVMVVWEGDGGMGG